MRLGLSVTNPKPSYKERIVIDGWHRLMACMALGIDPHVTWVTSDLMYEDNPIIKAIPISQAYTLALADNVFRKQVSSGQQMSVWEALAEGVGTFAADQPECLGFADQAGEKSARDLIQKQREIHLGEIEKLKKRNRVLEDRLRRISESGPNPEDLARTVERLAGWARAEDYQR